MANELGMKAWHAGPIDKSVVAESLTSVLIFMSKRYSFPGPGKKSLRAKPPDEKTVGGEYD